MAAIGFIFGIRMYVDIFDASALLQFTRVVTIRYRTRRSCELNPSQSPIK